MESDIIRLSFPSLNDGNGDVVIGMPVAPLGLGISKFAGQLGKYLWVDPSQCLFNAVVGNLYGGRFRYVRVRAADAAAPVVGQIAFWDTTVANWTQAYQVTTVENLSSVDNAVAIAGIFINRITPGRYWLIQEAGVVPIQFRANITNAGAVGVATYAAAVGAGVDNGFADVLTNANPVAFSDFANLKRRYLGVAITAPANGSLTNVALDLHNVMG